jgi:hypothetical protein
MYYGPPCTQLHRRHMLFRCIMMQSIILVIRSLYVLFGVVKLGGGMRAVVNVWEFNNAN